MLLLINGFLVNKSLTGDISKPQDLDFESNKCNGVMPFEIDQKLSRLLIEQQESQIVDLESELQLTNSKLVEKESELQALKDCVKRLTYFSLTSPSDTVLSFEMKNTQNSSSYFKRNELLARNNIIHRDLKSANLLMDENGIVKVSDFGVARVQNKSGDMTAETGTYRWMAPEVIEHRPYNHKANIFSFGIVLWELLTKKLPYDNLTPLQAAISVVQKGSRPVIPDYIHPEIVGLLEQCWQQARPVFEARIFRDNYSLAEFV